MKKVVRMMVLGIISRLLHREVQVASSPNGGVEGCDPLNVPLRGNPTPQVCVAIDSFAGLASDEDIGPSAS
jgi:hypothetical protein